MYSTIGKYLYDLPHGCLPPEPNGQSARENFVKSPLGQHYNREKVMSEFRQKSPDSYEYWKVDRNRPINVRENFTTITPVKPNETKTEIPLQSNQVLPSELASLGNTADPRVWGPYFWTTLHISASHYPIEASPIVRERMKGRILSIPYEIPCQTCRNHAVAFVEKHRDNLDQIVSGRHQLGKFYVDFHNQVNKRYGKPEWTYEQAYRKYSGNTLITPLE